VFGSILCALFLVLLVLTAVYVYLYKWQKNKLQPSDKEQCIDKKKELFMFGIDKSPRLSTTCSSEDLDVDLEMELVKTGVDMVTGSLSSLSDYPQSRSSLKRGMSIATSRSSDEDDTLDPSVTMYGRLWLSAWYDNETFELYVHLIRAKSLRGRGMNHAPRDPFVRIYLLPDENNFHQSLVRKKTLSPKFNETFKFELNKEEIPIRSIKLTVYDVDTKNVRHTLGHVVIPLVSIDLKSRDILYRDLEQLTQRRTYMGELQIALRCNPYTDRLRVTVLCAKNLPIKEQVGESTGVRIRVELYHGRKVVKIKQTSFRDLGKMEFYETCSFGVSCKYLESCYLVFTILLRRSGTNIKDESGRTRSLSGGSSGSLAEAGLESEVPFGKVILGPFMFARGEELQHWQDMISNPRVNIERWHRIDTLAEEKDATTPKMSGTP
jgi:hypothetical protein